VIVYHDRISPVNSIFEKFMKKMFFNFGQDLY